jgi:hypothetical protein
MKRAPWRKRWRPRLVPVELGANGLPVRIFRSKKLAARFSAPICYMLRSSAIKLIREQVFERSRHKDEKTDDHLTWDSMHLHEKQPRGMKGFILGEYSLENSIAVSRRTHDKEHSDRKPEWSTKNNESRST